MLHGNGKGLGKTAEAFFVFASDSVASRCTSLLAVLDDYCGLIVNAVFFANLA